MELPATKPVPGASSHCLHSPRQRLCRKTSKKGMLMGWWLRRCSSICPRTSCGMGKGSYQGPQVLLPSPPAGQRQAGSTRPSLSAGDSLTAPRPRAPAQPCLPRPTWMQPAKMLLVSFLYRPANFSHSVTSSSRAGASDGTVLCFSRALDRASWVPTWHITTTQSLLALPRRCRKPTTSCSTY